MDSLHRGERGKKEVERKAMIVSMIFCFLLLTLIDSDGVALLQNSTERWKSFKGKEL
jgi:hypothetical protein